MNRLTAQFPSTTAAHITCIHTGLPPGRSGVFEWQYYEPSLDAIITPLPFARADSKQPNSLPREAAQTVFPQGTLYQELGQLGVESFVFQSRAFTPSTCSDTYLQGAQVHPCYTFSEALTNLATLLQKPRSGTGLLPVLLRPDRPYRPLLRAGLAAVSSRNRHLFDCG